MNIVSAATRAVAKTADVTTAAAGAVGGAAVNGVIGGLRGAASGVRAGLDNGSQSPAAAALTIGAIGAAGLVEWPVLLTVGGAALVVRQLNQRSSAEGSSVGRPLESASPRRRRRPVRRHQHAKQHASPPSRQARQRPRGAEPRSEFAPRAAARWRHGSRHGTGRHGRQRTVRRHTESALLAERGPLLDRGSGTRRRRRRTLGRRRVTSGSARARRADGATQPTAVAGCGDRRGGRAVDGKAVPAGRRRRGAGAARQRPTRSD